MWVCAAGGRVLVCSLASCARVTCEAQVRFEPEKRDDGPEGLAWKINDTSVTDRVCRTPGAVFVFVSAHTHVHTNTNGGVCLGPDLHCVNGGARGVLLFFKLSQYW